VAAGGEQMTAVPGTKPAGTSEATTGPPAGRRRPWWIWAVPFAVLFVMLCVRNRFLFTTKLYEQGDAGANSILIEQAKHFTLLVGNYSRERFNHPGPAYMYVQAFGEYLFQNALHVVPTAWNAHMLSVFVLDSAFVALAVGIAYGWTRSLRGAAGCFAVLAGFAIAYPPIVNSDWMPYMYVLAYAVFLLAAASVVAGRGSDAWIFALTGWFLIHGHACFLLFVPVTTLAVLAAVLWPRRRRLRSWTSTVLREQRRNWVPVVVISAVFFLPIAVNLVLHWPGDFGKYLSYGSSSRGSGHSARHIVQYALWFWWPHRHAWLAPVLLYAAALAVTLRLRRFWAGRGPLRTFLLAVLAINVVSSLAFLLYAAVGIDDLTEYYIGYFYWSAPLLTVLVIVLAGLEVIASRSPASGARAATVPADEVSRTVPVGATAAPSAAAASSAGEITGTAAGRRPWTALNAGTALAVLAAAVTFVTMAVIPGTRTSTNDIDESLPGVVATLAARAPGQMVVLHIDHPAWVETTGFLVQAERSGVKACLDDPWFTFLMSKQFICTPAQAAAGPAYWFYTPAGLPAGTHVILRFSGIAVAPAPK
jgi:hypothetical protein